MPRDYAEHIAFLLRCLFHAENAYRYTNESEFSHQARIEGRYRCVGQELLAGLTEDGAEAIVVRDKSKRVIYVACRGTELPKLTSPAWSIWYALQALFLIARSDAGRDLNARMVADTRLRGYVHQGFKDHSDNLIDDILMLIRANDDYNVIFIGHSLGGAMALRLAAIAANETAACISHVVTYGAPAIGDRTWVKYVTHTIGADRIHRVVNCGDVVPRMKLHRLTSWLQAKPIMQSGGLEYFDRFGEMETKIGWLEQLADRTADRWTKTQPTSMVTGAAYHSIKGYRGRLEQALSIAGQV